jgi:hypothetical protein
MPVRFLITTLKPGVDPAEYEQWVREYDYKIARGRENMIRYEVYRIETPIQGVEGAQWSYLERIEVKSIEQAEIDATSESGIELRRQLFGKFVDRQKNVTFVTSEIT